MVSQIRSYIANRPWLDLRAKAAAPGGSHNRWMSANALIWPFVVKIANNCFWRKIGTHIICRPLKFAPPRSQSPDRRRCAWRTGRNDPPAVGVLRLRLARDALQTCGRGGLCQKMQIQDFRILPQVFCFSHDFLRKTGLILSLTKEPFFASCSSATAPPCDGFIEFNDIHIVRRSAASFAHYEPRTLKVRRECAPNQSEANPVFTEASLGSRFRHNIGDVQQNVFFPMPRSNDGGLYYTYWHKCL